MVVQCGLRSSGSVDYVLRKVFFEVQPARIILQCAHEFLASMACALGRLTLLLQTDFWPVTRVAVRRADDMSLSLHFCEYNNDF